MKNKEWIFVFVAVIGFLVLMAIAMRPDFYAMLFNIDLFDVCEINECLVA